MNQTQRQFLLTAIETQFKKEKEAFMLTKPKAPNLNNYLTAAILDGTFQFRELEEFRKSIRDRVVGLGPDESLMERRNNMWDEKHGDKYTQHILIPAGILFVLPTAYAIALEKFMGEKARYDEHMTRLAASFEAMKIKVQLGSDAALKSLVDQADALCSMSLTDSSQLLIASNKQ